MGLGLGGEGKMRGALSYTLLFVFFHFFLKTCLRVDTRGMRFTIEETYFPFFLHTQEQPLSVFHGQTTWVGWGRGEVLQLNQTPFLYKQRGKTLILDTKNNNNNLLYKKTI